MNTILFENYSLWPFDINNRLFQDFFYQMRRTNSSVHNGLNIHSQDTAIKYIKSPLSEMLGMSSPENGFMAVDTIRNLFCATWVVLIWDSARDVCTYRIDEQRSLMTVCAYDNQSLFASHTQSRDVDEDSNQNLDNRLDFLFIVTPIVGVYNCSMFCCTLLYAHSSVAIILTGKRELIALLNLSS